MIIIKDQTCVWLPKPLMKFKQNEVFVLRL